MEWVEFRRKKQAFVGYVVWLLRWTRERVIVAGEVLWEVSRRGGKRTGTETKRGEWGREMERPIS